MKKSNLSMSNLKVGLTVFIGIIIFLIFIMIVGSESNLFVKTYSLKLFVKDVDGLTKGSMVSLGGLKIGSVENMDFFSDKFKNGIDITLSIKREYQNQITDKSSATIKTIGLLGDKYVDISIGKPGENILGDWKYLPVNKSFSLEDMAVDLKNTVIDFRTTIKKIDDIVESINEGKGSLGKIIKSSETIDGLNNFVVSLNNVILAIRDKKGFLGKAIYDHDLYKNLQESLSKINNIADSIKSGKGSFGKFILEDSLYNNITSSSMRINRLLSKTQEHDNVVGGLLNDNKLYQDFSKILEELNLLLKDIKSDPKKYFKLSVF